MPPFLGMVVSVVEGVAVQLAILFGIKNAYLIVTPAQPASAVVNWVDVQLRSARFARQFTETLGKLLLKVVIEIVLFAEEYYASLRNCALLASAASLHKQWLRY
jgi:hypothetical protein